MPQTVECPCAPRSQAGLHLLCDLLRDERQAVLIETGAPPTPTAALELALRFIPAINECERLYLNAKVMQMYVAPWRLRVGGSLAGGLSGK